MGPNWGPRGPGRGLVWAPLGAPSRGRRTLKEKTRFVQAISSVWLLGASLGTIVDAQQASFEGSVRPIRRVLQRL